MNKTWFGFLIDSILVLSILIGLTESKCWQKNTNREASRDIFLCKNQYFEEGKKVADPENCDCYYDCNFKQQPCYVCCPDGQVFNSLRSECVLRDAFRCQNQPTKYQCEGHGLFRNKENCRKYWDCRQKDSLPLEMACDDGHYWDDRAKVCRRDSEVSRSSCNN